MPILTPTISGSDHQLRIRVKEHLLKEIEAYNEWAGLHSVNDFIEKASLYILENDLEWSKIKQTSLPYIFSQFEHVIKIAENRNKTEIIFNTTKPCLEILKEITPEQLKKFSTLEKMLEESELINDARIFLNIVADLYAGMVRKLLESLLQLIHILLRHQNDKSPHPPTRKLLPYHQ